MSIVPPPRSTKAGAETPATHADDARPLLDVERSTKAGAETPATHRKSLLVMPSGCALNEGRGRDPGDTSRSVRSRTHSHSAQRRPGPRPRRHPQVRARSQIRFAPLNEGRGRDPGDTISPLFQSAGFQSAQRRPGPRPRRHAGVHEVRKPVATRSTKAGAETPATPTTRRRLPMYLTRSTEGRGRDPGDTPCTSHRSAATGCAQRRPGPRPRRHSTRKCWSACCAPTLNEGRGRDPGDTANRRGTPSWTQLGTRSADA